MEWLTYLYPFHGRKSVRFLMLFAFLGVGLLSRDQLDDSSVHGSKRENKLVQPLVKNRRILADPNVYSYTHPFLERGDAFNERDAYDSAIVAYKAAAHQLKRSREWKAYVWALNKASTLYVYAKEQDYKKGLPLLQEALAVGIHRLGSNHPFVATTYVYLGKYYFAANDAKQALENYTKALSIRKRYFGDHNVYVANIHDEIADVYSYLLFDQYSAEKHVAQALRIRKRVLASDDPSFIYGYYNLAVINESIGNYGKATSYCFEAMRYVPLVEHNRDDWQETLASLLAGLSLNDGDTTRAIRELRTIVASNQRSKDYNDLGAYWNQLGDIYRLQRNYSRALDAYQQSLRALRRQANLAPELKLNAYFGLAVVYRERGQYNAAERHLRACLAGRIRLYGPQHVETAAVYEEWGNFSLQRHDRRLALQYLQKALWSSTFQGQPKNERVPTANQFIHPLRALSIVKVLAHQLKQSQVGVEEQPPLENTLAYYFLADSLLMNLQASYERENAQLSLAEASHAIYEEALDCVWQLWVRTNQPKYLAWALHFMDRRKATLLLEAVEEEAVFEKVSFLQAYQHQRKTLQRKAYFLQDKLQAEQGKAAPNSSLLKNLHARTIANEAEQKQLTENLRKKHPQMEQLLHKNNPVGLQQVQALLRQGHDGLVEYFWGDSAIYALGVGTRGNGLLKIANTPALRQGLQTYQAILQKGYDWQTAERDFHDFQLSALLLHNTLFKPIVDRVLLQNAKKTNEQRKILLILDGPLFSIPFEALVQQPTSRTRVDYRRLPYVLKDYLFTYHYAVSLALRSAARQPTLRPMRVLALGFSQPDSGIKPNAPPATALQAGLSDLPGAAAELRAIASTWKGQFLLGEQATEERFKSEAPQYDILHLALHGQADQRQSSRSKLFFQGDAPSKEDGQLYTYELYGLALGASLTVLSACETGGGKIHKAEGVYSLARGFLYAGCPTVVTSLWKASDLPTARLMEAFYRELSTGCFVEESLWRAKTTFLEEANSRNAHPSNWATFVLIGKANVRMEESTNPLLSLLVVMSILLLTLTARMVFRRSKLTKVSN